MSAFQTQDQFAGALLDAERVLPRTVSSHTARTPHKRFAVYRNNVIVGLSEAMRAQFPATEKIVGTEFFAALAQVYVSSEPPRSPVMMNYGERFPGFIERFEPAAEIPYLADVARLEFARTQAYHAADAAPLDADAWQHVEADTLADLRVILHPSLRIVRSAFPVVTIWSMNSGGMEPASIEDCGPEDAVIARPRGVVEVRQLPPGGATFLNALTAGTTLGKAATAASNADVAFDLPVNLAGLIGGELATALLPSSTMKGIAS
ncbi:MAG TPA: DNA-binding domain-containing protein [Pseudolabrys sp.]|nr:DNA-binding domain-containing protein [Pseudolabrys sp.]